MPSMSGHQRRLLLIKRSMLPEQLLIAAIIHNAIQDAKLTPRKPTPENYKGERSYADAISKYNTLMADKKSATEFLKGETGMLQEYLELFGADLKVIDVIHKMGELEI